MGSNNINTMVRFVADTSAVISYFSGIFGVKSVISGEATGIMHRAFIHDPLVRLSISSITFVEVFEKWISSEEFYGIFMSEVFYPIANASGIEIKEIDEEVLEMFLKIDDKIINLENHDKIILASAMMLDCPLITCDSKIINYCSKHHVIPRIIT